MKTRALTASEATARLIEIGFGKEWDSHNFIQDNDYTRPYGETNFTYANPIVNRFGPEKLYWDMVGVRYSIIIREDYKGNSNVLLYRWEGSHGECIADYNKMKAAEKKAFMEMLENAVRIDWPKPQEIRDCFRDASYKDERGVCHTAFIANDGMLHTLAEREPFLNFFPGEHYEYNEKPFIVK